MKRILPKYCLQFFIILFTIFTSLATTAQTVQTFSTSGSWVCPAGVTKVFVETWGAGGAGGGIGALATGRGGGGGGGAYSNAVITVVPGTTYNYVVGVGGVGAAAAGPAGGSSSFNGLLASPGGTGGGTGALGAKGIGGIGYDFNGGDGAPGASSGTARSGGGGGSGGSVEDGGLASTSAVTGGVAGNVGGGAGASGRTSNGVGTAGSIPGGGGGGAYTTSGVTLGYAGGSGARGQVQLTYTGTCTIVTNTANVNTTSMNWSTAASWSLGHVPTACENAVIIVDRSVATSNETVTITMPSFTVQNLTIRNISASVRQVLIAANVSSLSNINILGNLTIETYKGGGAGPGCPNNRTAFGGTTCNFNVYGDMILGRPAGTAVAATEGHATVQGNPSTWNLGGDLTFNPKGYNTNRGTNYKMNAGGTHYMVNNTDPNNFNDTIKGNRFETINLGNANPSTIILSGTRYDFSISTLIAGDLNIGPNSTLDIPANYSFNITVANAGTTSTIRLASGALLRIGGNASLVTDDGTNLGVAGSNFPGGYDVYTLDPNSTVEYYGSNAITQTLYNGATYGHLIANNGSGSGRAQKNTTGALVVATDMNINALADVILGGAVACAGPFNVRSTGGLYMGPYVASGAGAFTLETGGYLGMGHVQGITAGAFATGNVQMTGGRSFHTGGNYIYNGTAAQITGTGLPTTCNDLYIDNPTTVTIATSQTVTGLNYLKQGVFDIGLNNKITITGATGVLNSITGKMKANQGLLDMNGTAGTQTIAGSWFVNRNISTLINSNTTGLTIAGTAGDTLLISSALLYGPSTINSAITTNNNLTLLSRDTATARFGELKTGSGNTITGNVNVERYIKNLRKWRHLAWNTTSAQTAQQSWMDKNVTANGNINPGYGTIVTDEKTTWNTNKFDSRSVSGPSVKYYDPIANGYIGIPNTDSYAMNSQSAYFNFVRGDRSCTPANALTSTTVLRSTGTLKTGNQVFTITANKFGAVGNPYASAIDLRLLDTLNLTSTFYVWDPNLTGGYGLGAYQTIYMAGAQYRVMPGGGSYGGVGSVVDTLESGQAMYVRARASAGTLTFKESAKTIGARTMARQTENTPVVYALFSLVDPGSTTLVDGAMGVFDDDYSNDVDDDDALKLPNTSENISFKRNNSLLAIERRRTFEESDTLFINMSGLRIHQYQWDISSENVSNLNCTAFLIDKYLDTRTELTVDRANTIVFDVTSNPASYAADRFMIVFRGLQRALPVRFTNISAVRNADKTVIVKYTTQTEINMQDYRIQSGADGIHFNNIGTQLPTANNGGGASYSFLDTHASTGTIYYRVQGNSTNGRIQYTAIAKVGPLSDKADMSIYPNPVVDGTVNIRFCNQPKGAYSIKVTNKIGQLIHTESIKIENNNSVNMTQLDPNTARGSYQATVTDVAGKSTTISFIIQ